MLACSELLTLLAQQGRGEGYIPSHRHGWRKETLSFSFLHLEVRLHIIQS
jgi:hypothetical protein